MYRVVKRLLEVGGPGRIVVRRILLQNIGGNVSAEARAYILDRLNQERLVRTTNEPRGRQLISWAPESDAQLMAVVVEAKRLHDDWESAQRLGLHG